MIGLMFFGAIGLRAARARQIARLRRGKSAGNDHPRGTAATHAAD
jgi:hypothetical protein